ncbi:MAG: ATP-binding protein [Lachnospiraceae bacterium]|jgi:DNA polymerase-3 subunit delta'
MSEFKKVLGNKRITDYFSEAHAGGKLSHAYIINGPAGSGKKTLVRLLSSALLCERISPGKDNGQANMFSLSGMPSPAPRSLFAGPCGHCPACAKTSSGNHPDLIRLEREKKNIIAVDDIRSQIVADIVIRPFYGPYKLYIIDDAQLMSESAQSALLKTIEEPPSYGIIFLLTDNADTLLETVRSRCICFDMESLSPELIGRELMKAFPLNKRDAMQIAAYSRGNLGEALEYAGSGDKIELTERIVSVLKRISGMSALGIFNEAAAWGKEGRTDISEIIRKWFRDVLLIKNAGEAESLFFPGHVACLTRQAGAFDYEDINNIFLQIDISIERLNANVKAEAAFENLLLSIRRFSKKGK